jgi:hypothetical protein
MAAHYVSYLHRGDMAAHYVSYLDRGDMAAHYVSYMRHGDMAAHYVSYLRHGYMAAHYVSYLRHGYMATSQYASCCQHTFSNLLDGEGRIDHLAFKITRLQYFCLLLVELRMSKSQVLYASILKTTKMYRIFLY